MELSSKQWNAKQCDQLGYYISRVFSAFVQAFFLSHALFLLIAGYEINFDITKKITSSHYVIVTASVLLLTALILFARHKKLGIADHLTYHAWLVYGVVLATMTQQASVVLGIFLVTVAAAFYARRHEIRYLPIYIYLIVMFTASILRGGNELPPYFRGLPGFPIAFDETIASLLIFLPIMCIGLAWRTLDDSAKKLSVLGEKIPTLFCRILLIACLIFHVAGSGQYLLLRLRTFSSSTYDMGIFTQMYHYMSRTGLPWTTLERDTLLSHFKVHVSPILYLFLPIFKLFPSARTIQLAQVVLTASGVIPAYLLAKLYGLGKRARLLWSSLYLVLPAMIFSSFYDFHENVFLTPIILFLIFFIAKGSLAGTAIFTLLTLMVKEDAFLYVAAIALYLLFGAKDRQATAFERKKATLVAISMMVIGVAWFTSALTYLTRHGMGAMTSRFNNLISIPKLGLLSVIPTFFFNLTLYVETLFVKSKMGYILIALTSFGFIPLLNKRFHRLFLWVPFIVINLMSNYEYQYHIDFQYNYGSHALLFILALLTYADYAKALSGAYKKNRHDAACSRSFDDSSCGRNRIKRMFPSYRTRVSIKRAALSSLLLLAFVASSTQTHLMLKKRMHGISLISRHFAPPHIETLALLDQIPRDAIVVADGFVTVPLADIEQLYDANYYDWTKNRPLPDYIVLRRGAIDHYEHYDTISLLGYKEETEMSSDWLLVMKRPH